MCGITRKCSTNAKGSSYWHNGTAILHDEENITYLTLACMQAQDKGIARAPSVLLLPCKKHIAEMLFTCITHSFQ